MALAMFFLVMIAINVAICYLYMLILQRVPPQHRKMEPTMVWLLLIPCFNLVWNFFVYLRVPESVQSYLESTGRTDQGDCGRGVGMAYAICTALTVIPFVNYLTGPAALVLLIIFLVKMFQVKKLLPQAEG